jgi:hypothetical protein
LRLMDLPQHCLCGQTILRALFVDKPYLLE